MTKYRGTSRSTRRSARVSLAADLQVNWQVPDGCPPVSGEQLEPT